jgi:hypothetical protein
MSHRGQGIHLHWERAASAGRLLTWRDGRAYHSRRAGHARKAWYYHCFPDVARDFRSTSTCKTNRMSVSRGSAPGQEGCVMLTSVIERLANFSSRFAWLLPFIGFWGGERKRPPRPITCPSAITCGKRHSSLQRCKRVRMTANAYTSNTYPFLQRPDGKNKHGGLRPPPNDGRRKPGPPLVRRSPRWPKPSCGGGFCAPFCSDVG